MRELLIIVPSRGRPASLPRMVDAWRSTDGYDRADLLFAVDLDDPTLPGYEEAVRALPGWSTMDALAGLTVLGSWLPMVHKLNHVATMVVNGGPFLHGRPGGHRFLGFFGDDHLPRTPGWADRFVDQLHDLGGAGIVYGDDGYQGENLPTHWAMHAAIVHQLDRMVPAPVEHLYCDNAIKDLGAAAGCLRYLPDVRIEHMHPIAGKAAQDEQYRRVNSSKQFATDRAAYHCWVRDGLALDAQLVRDLRQKTEITTDA